MLKDGRPANQELDLVLGEPFATAESYAADTLSTLSGLEKEQFKKAPEAPWRIETLTTASEMRQNSLAWMELEKESTDTHAVFQSYVWCESWAAVFCEHNPGLPQPRIFMIYRGDLLMAILPMMVSRHMGAQTLTLFGEPHSQIANAIVRAGYDCRDGLRLCVEQAAMLTDSDVVALGPLPDTCALAQALDANYLSDDPADCMSLVNWGSATRVEDYVRQLSKNRRRDYNRKHAALSNVGRVDYRIVQLQDDDFKPLVTKALAFKRDWLERNGIFSVGLSQKGVGDFLTRFVQFDGAFRPEVEVLSVGQEIVAINISLVGLNMRHCYLSSYDHGYQSYSPGTILHQLSIRDGVESGLIGFNFLGHPTHFKTMWSSDFVGLVRYQKGITLRGRLWVNGWTKFLRPNLKKAFTLARHLTEFPLIGAYLGKALSRLTPPGAR